MKRNLLALDSKGGLEVASLLEKKVTFSFDFKKQELKSNVLEEVKGKVSSYIFSKALVNAVNAAIITGRPLLLKGEPGCGKTKLAKAVAAELYGDKLGQHYFEWHVKSRSIAKEGAYHFDHVSRLRDATLAEKDTAAEERVKDPSKYITLGPMGLAFKASTQADPAILLIDEIDKGDIDFPNDLLLELDEMRFKIPELSQKKEGTTTQEDFYIETKKENRPLVFITSNDERALPPAFLRRCIYYRIPFFEDAILEKIVKKKMEEFYEEFKSNDFGTLKKVKPKEIKSVVAKFLELKKEVISTVKSPSTSELLDWFKLLLYKANTERKSITRLIEDEKLQQLALKIIN